MSGYKSYEKLIKRLEKEYQITEIGLFGESLNAINELIKQRDELASILVDAQWDEDGWKNRAIKALATVKESK